MVKLKIYRGANKIGGGRTGITAGGERIPIDFGANLPDAGEHTGKPLFFPKQSPLVWAKRFSSVYARQIFRYHITPRSAA